MSSREKLQAALEDILGSRNVYFAPPESVKMRYPCFVYNYQRLYTRRADNKAYIKVPHYQVTYISKDPDSGMTDTMLDRFEMCSHERSYMSDSLSHDVYDLYFL